MFKNKLKADKKILKKLYDEKYKWEDKYSETNSVDDRNKTDEKIVEIDEFIENIYAKDVFDYYCKKKPVLVREKNGEEYTWEKAFGLSFEEVPKTLRHSLVGLVEGSGRYRFKND